jgi:hypothetical protein
MVTYLYWTAIFAVVGAVFYGIGIKGKSWKVGSIVALLDLAGWVGSLLFSSSANLCQKIWWSNVYPCT